MGTHPSPHLVIVLGLFVIACGDALVEPEPAPVVTGVTLETPENFSFRTLSVSLDRAASIQVDYWTDDSPRLRTVIDLAADQHDVFLPRLRAASSYQYEVRPITASGQEMVYSGEFSTEPLPSVFAGIQITTIGTPTFPLTMLEIAVPRDPGRVIVDRDGNIVWYRLPPEGGGVAGFTRLTNGDFVFNDRTGLAVVAADLSLVNALPAGEGERMHHDVIVTPQNTVYFLADEDGVVNDTVWTGEAIWEWNPETGSLHKRWNSFDFLSPTVDRGSRTRVADWIHANSLSIGPRGNVVMSSFWLHEVISIAADFTSLEWRLGGSSSIFEDADGAMGAGQHTAAEVSPGRVLLFDNGLDRSSGEEYSRALEIELDDDMGTANIVWEFRPQPDIYSPVVSSARRLSNGNTVVAFGTAEGFTVGQGGTASGPIAVYEVTPANRIVWFMRVDGVDAMYRATPLSDIAGEWEVLE